MTRQSVFSINRIHNTISLLDESTQQPTTPQAYRPHRYQHPIRRW